MCIRMRAKCLKLHPFVHMQKYLLLLLSKLGLYNLLSDNGRMNMLIGKFDLTFSEKLLFNDQIKEKNII